MSNHPETITITYEVHRLEDGRWNFYPSDWDFQTDQGPKPTSQELADMLDDWLRNADETEGTWALTADDGEYAISGMVEL